MTTKPVFDAAQFADGPYRTAAEKALIGNRIVKFIQGGYSQKNWGKSVYKWLSTHFLFIAHCHSDGFFTVYFENPEGKLRFLSQILRLRPQPTNLDCDGDLEEAIQKWVKENNILSVAEEEKVVWQREIHLNQLTQLIRFYPQDAERILGEASDRGEAP